MRAAAERRLAAGDAVDARSSEAVATLVAAASEARGFDAGLLAAQDEDNAARILREVAANGSAA